MTGRDINVLLNGKERKIKENMTVSDLLREFNINEEVVAVEINMEIIDRKEFRNVFIKENDKIELVHFMGGG